MNEEGLESCPGLSDFTMGVCLGSSTVDFALVQGARESYEALRELVSDRNSARDLCYVPMLYRVRNAMGITAEIVVDVLDT